MTNYTIELSEIELEKIYSLIALQAMKDEKTAQELEEKREFDFADETFARANFYWKLAKKFLGGQA